MKKSITILLTILLFTSYAIGVSVPYEGLSLKWNVNYDRNCSFDGADTEENRDLIYQYEEKNDSTILVKNQARSSIERYNLDTREILNGTAKGQKTSHWINTTVSLGDKFKILNNTYTVVSLSESIDYKSKNIETVKVQRDISEKINTRDGIPVSVSGTHSIWYHKNTGLKIEDSKSTTRSSDSNGYYDNCEIEKSYSLESTGKDSDEDGIDDIDELILENLNPTDKDTDGDFLSDSLDPMPKNPIMPLGALLLGLFIIFGILYAIKSPKSFKSKKDVEKVESKN